MHGPINVKSPNNTSKWQMGFNSAFEGLINETTNVSSSKDTSKLKQCVSSDWIASGVQNSYGVHRHAVPWETAVLLHLLSFLCPPKSLRFDSAHILLPQDLFQRAALKQTACYIQWNCHTLCNDSN
jgi:hypothetical protein